MKVLVDTHTLVWALADPNALSARSRQALSDSEVLASIASLWELLLKKGKAGALLTDPLPWWERNVIGNDIPTLAIRPSHVMALNRLPDLHRDPFDRILVTQSMIEKAPLVSRDAYLSEYGISVIW